MKRFWERVTVAVDEAGHIVLLDGKPMHLPGGALLRIGPRPVADAVAAEWQAAAGGAPGSEMSFDDTPLTRLAGTAQERVSRDPATTIDGIAAYAESDLLCYRAETPPQLAQRQAREWQPWLDWAALAYDAPLKIGTGIVHVRQPDSSLRALRHAVAAFDPLTLAALGVAVPALGSVVLGLALAGGRLDAARAHALSTLDERFQAELWGEDDEALARRARIFEDIEAAERLIRLVRG